MIITARKRSGPTEFGLSPSKLMKGAFGNEGALRFFSAAPAYRSVVTTVIFRVIYISVCALRSRPDFLTLNSGVNKEPISLNCGYLNPIHSPISVHA